MPIAGTLELSNGTAPTTPAAGNLDLYVDVADKRVKSIDETPATRVYVDRDSVETLTHKTLHADGVITSKGGGVGYETGAGGTIGQATNKSTGVTLNTFSGQITMDPAALGPSVVVSFLLTNAKIAAGDVLVLNHISGGTVGAYLLNAQSAGASATITVTNISAGSLSEAIVIAFAIIKAVTA
jgi:hypothetical protein